MRERERERLCVCVREREREIVCAREREGGREGERERVGEREKRESERERARIPVDLDVGVECPHVAREVRCHLWDVLAQNRLHAECPIKSDRPLYGIHRVSCRVRKRFSLCEATRSLSSRGIACPKLQHQR